MQDCKASCCPILKDVIFTQNPWCQLPEKVSLCMILGALVQKLISQDAILDFTLQTKTPEFLGGT
jgi:hypothetical protein